MTRLIASSLWWSLFFDILDTIVTWYGDVVFFFVFFRRVFGVGVGCDLMRIDTVDGFSTYGMCES
jgi:hypothetical protein